MACSVSQKWVILPSVKRKLRKNDQHSLILPKLFSRNASVCESRKLFRWVKQKLPEKASVLAGLGALLLRAGDWRGEGGGGGHYCRKKRKRGQNFALAGNPTRAFRMAGEKFYHWTTSAGVSKDRYISYYIPISQYSSVSFLVFLKVGGSQLESLRYFDHHTHFIRLYCNYFILQPSVVTILFSLC